VQELAIWRFVIIQFNDHFYHFVVNFMSKGFKFYDKVAKKFGGYHTSSSKSREYPKGDPEKIFLEKIIEFSGKNKIALDIGCADGRFTLSIAPRFKEVVGVDLSLEMLKSARRYQHSQKIKNVSFQAEDGEKTRFDDNSFDIIYSRRGPTFYKEFRRLLKPSGYFAEITVGEKDCADIKKIFGRGQGFGNWSKSTMKVHKEELVDNGFKIIFAREYFYNEYYKTYKDLDIFLQGVPIFEDYNLKRDKKRLEKYTNKFSLSKGIILKRHRIVIVAQKY
jgi:ubiquinone/menaquinone biosynthesis C-methylase UbiE